VTARQSQCDLQDVDKLDVQTIADSDNYHELKAYAYVCIDQNRAARRQRKLYLHLEKMRGLLLLMQHHLERDDIKYDLARSKRSKRGVCLWLEHTLRTGTGGARYALIYKRTPILVITPDYEKASSQIFRGTEVRDPPS